MAFVSPLSLAEVILVLAAVVALYIAEECGWPQFKSDTIARLYAKLTVVLLVSTSAICLPLLMFFLFITGLAL